MIEFRLIIPLSLALLGPSFAAAQDEGKKPTDLGDNPIRLEDKNALDAEKEKMRLDDGAGGDKENLPEADGENGKTIPDPTDRAVDTARNQEDTGDLAKLRKLDIEDRKKVAKMLAEAAEFVGGIRVQEAFERIVEVEAIAPDLFALHNLKGAAYTKIREFDKARASFETAVGIAPNSFMGRFNLTELEFVAGAHQEKREKGSGKPMIEKAIAGFNDLIVRLRRDIGDLEKGQVDAKAANDIVKSDSFQKRITATSETIKLIEFKTLLCHLLLGDKASADKLLETFHYMEDVPVYYFSHAALAYNDEDEKKARSWLQSARGIYPKEVNDIYLDSFVEIGWIESFQ